MKKSFRKTLAYLLCILLVFTSLPLVATAENATAQNKVENNGVNKPTEEPYIISELIEKRESNIKHFRMSDGSINAVVYSEDVHFIDENNEFIDINNTLNEDSDGTDNIYSNENNIASVKFMKKSNPNKLYTIDKGAHKIKVSIEGVSKVNGVVETSESDILSKTQFALENIGSKITYSDILENTDFEYTLFSTELKENIILKEKVDYNSLVYTYHLSGSMTAIQEDSKSIKLYDKDGNFVFNISAPVMWDAKGETFEDLALDILETTNSKIKVKISWNIPENFKYPVTIDPVMEFRIDRNSIQDTHIISDYPTTNYDVNNHIRIRNNGYAMVKFPTPSLTSGDKIINAELMLYPYGAFDTSSSVYSNENSYNPPLNITAHKILRAWEETTATYSNVNADNGFYESIVQSYRVVDGNNGFYKWDITRLVNEWTEGYSANHGVLLKYESPPSDGSMFDSFFCSTNGKFIDSNAWPRMVYQYINTTGVEDYFSYHTQNLGAAGTGYTNDLTGNLTVINPVLQTGGSLAPITVSLIYNSNNVNNAQTPYGTGWKLNWAQKIDWSVKSNFNNTQYVKYTDTDGTNHFFTVDNSTGIWTDEINPDRKVYFIESSGDYKMTDSSGTCMYFKRKGTLNEWYLYKTVDIYGNYIQLTLNSSNMNRVEKIYSSTGNEVNLVYNQYGYLTSIKYYDEGTEKNISIGYNGHVQTANNGISDIYYADGTSVQYHYYNNSKYLSKAVDISGQNITYNYTWKTPMRVNYVAEYSNNSELGNVMQMKYEATSTTFTDVTNNRKYLYTFAQNGTLKGTVDITANDGNGYGQYYEYNNGNTTASSGKGNLTFISKNQKSTNNLLVNHSFEKDTNLPSFQVWNETTGTSTGGVSTDKNYIGSRSYKLYRHEQSNSSRVLGFYSKNLIGGTTYTLSAYVNTAGMVSKGKGASVFVTCTDFRKESEYVTETSNEWQRISVTFTPVNSGYVSICMNVCGAVGNVYFDNIQLEIGDLSDYNLLENAGFENDNSATPYGWSASTNKGSISTSQKIAGNRAISIQGKSTVDKHYMQTISIPNGKKGDTYVASAFAKANSVPASGWKFTVLVRFHKNGSKVNEQNILFNSYTTDWQKVSGVAKAEGDYDKVTFWLLYYKNCNTVYFDNAQLIRDNFGTSYTYDSKGNLLSTVDLEGKDEYTFKYNGNNQLIKESTISGGKILYSYNSSKKQQLDLVTAGGISTAYTYDSKGNATSTSTMGTELIEGKSYYLQNVYYSKYLNVTNSGTASGTTVGLADFGKNSAQRWKLIKNTDGSYSLSPECATNKILSVNGSALANSVNLALYSSGEKTYQKFKLVKKSGNTYCLDIAENTNYAIDCNGTNVYTYSMHHAEVQQFAFIPVANSNSSSNPAIISSATYSADGDYMTSATDSRGNTTSYEYNEDRGYLKSETNANGVTTNYSYYNNELLKNVSVPNGTETPTVNYGYDSYKRLSSITSPSGTVYGFAYDSFGRTNTIKLGTRTLSDYLYDSKGRVDTFTYGNGTTIKYGYDHLNRQTSTTINNVLRYNKLYDGSSRLLQIEDILLGKKIKYEYDILNRAVSEKLINTATNNIYAQLDIRYDNSKNRVAGYDVNIEGINKATDFVYGENKSAPDIITSVKHNGTKKLSYGYDSLNRLITRTLATGTAFTTEYTYIAGRTKGSETDDSALTTTLVKTVKNGEDTLEYAYDKLGNITSISKNGTIIESYTYDNLNQLKTVTVEKGEVDDVYTYTYDNGGNILSVTLNDEVIKTYTYGDSEWKDLLTNFNGTGFTYDNIGNPLTYRDGMSFTWADGRKLASITKGEENIAYTYDINGLRTSKTVNGVTTEYYWLNGILQGQKTGSEHIIFLYDENGMAYGFLVYENGVASGEYYYIFNAQGDVIGILDSTGTKVVEYTYNAWGELLSITGTLADTIGQKNPLRYRGYYFDSETGFYYLQSRYYDPVVQRFLNADSLIDNRGIITQNLFQYCGNNPVNNVDTNGNSWKDVKEWFNNNYDKTVKFIKNTYKKGKKVVSKVVSSFTVEIGVGMGLKGSVDAGGVTANVGMKFDSITAILNSKKSKIGQKQEAKCAVGIGPVEIGPAQTDWIPVVENDNYETNFSWVSADPVIEYGVELYLMYGFTFNVFIDLDILSEGVVMIFE